MKMVFEYTDASGLNPLIALYNEHGLKPFFKEVSFGMRMVYSTAYPVDGEIDDSDNFVTFMNTAFKNNPRALKASKCMLGHRPYSIYSQSDTHKKVLRELQVPIVEVERKLEFIQGLQLFEIGRDVYKLSDLGYWHPNHANLSTNSDKKKLLDLGNKSYVGSLVNNHSQFFYKNLANDMLLEIKNSPEFKLMYDYLFPMKRYMALSFVVASDGLSKFIPEPTDVLDRTKDSLKSIIDSLVNSVDYKHLPDPIANMLAQRLIRSNGGTSGKDPDMTKEILRIIWRTSLMILKGFVEMTDPAIIIAKNIIDIANAIQAATIAAIKKGIAIAKQTLQSGIDGSKNVLLNLELSLGIAAGTLNAQKTALPKVGDLDLSEKVTLNTDGSIIDEGTNTLRWQIEAKSLTPDERSKLSEDQLAEWDNFKKLLADAKKDLEEYGTVHKELKELESDLSDLEATAGKKIAEAEEIMKDVFSSPFLLPGMWAAMMPSILPYGGGLVPPPFVGGPPSTVPGMIYLALLLIDAYEEKIHDDMQKLDSSCEDQL